MDAALGDARWVLGMLRGLGVRCDLRDRRQPVLQPAHAAPGALPAVDGYQPPEDPLRGVARQIDATARLKAAFPQPGVRRLRLQLPAGVAAARRPACGRATGRPTSSASDAWRCRIPELAGGRARRAAAAAQADLPHVQRLHHRPAPRPGLRLLSARPGLCGAPEAPRILAVRTSRSADGAKTR